MAVNWEELDNVYEQSEVDDFNTEIPDGFYEALIVNIALEESKRDATPQLKWEFIITGPNYANKHLWKYSQLTPNPDSMKWLKGELRKIGFMGEKISAFINTANFYIDKTVKLNLKTTERNGQKRQAIYFSKLLDEAPVQPPPKSQTANFQDDIPF
ncbi:MAG: DUF669 domain-containing protein [Pseudomonadota bacterium]